ncbi:hypothetical protein O6H91_22G048800 [Diphasiastrum complanatum]|uniref:Uncharacterized protein n=1 Tax=Diphasiastrum complanatum TaxID=34168 RepID=A0ACC2AF81_DIPCM|nr:hypothetical protein O6H91_22G048800 [Diphasiastrum complanatum]
MCILCVASRWSRRIVTMLPWLIIPLIILWALSQLLPPGFRFEVTSPRLACVGVLLMSLGWYELVMPRLSQWRAHRSVLLRERRRIEAQEAAKWRKEAIRRCRNCLYAYREQSPAGGKFMCTYCGHVSKRPVLDLPNGGQGMLGASGVAGGGSQSLPHSTGGASPGAGVWNVKNVRGWGIRGWADKSEWCGGRGWIGKRCGTGEGWVNASDSWFWSYWPTTNWAALGLSWGAEVPGWGDNVGFWFKNEFCSPGEHGRMYYLFKYICLVFLMFKWVLTKRWIDENTMHDDRLGRGRSRSQRREEDLSGSHESRGEKARKKAEERRLARLERKQLEEEERKQREEVARLIEERRRLRDEKLEAERQSEREAAAEREREIRREREAERRRQEKAKEREKEKAKEMELEDARKRREIGKDTVKKCETEQVDIEKKGEQQTAPSSFNDLKKGIKGSRTAGAELGTKGSDFATKGVGNSQKVNPPKYVSPAKNGVPTASKIGGSRSSGTSFWGKGFTFVGRSAEGVSSTGTTSTGRSLLLTDESSDNPAPSSSSSPWNRMPWTKVWAKPVGQIESSKENKLQPAPNDMNRAAANLTLKDNVPLLQAPEIESCESLRRVPPKILSVRPGYIGKVYDSENDLTGHQIDTHSAAQERVISSPPCLFPEQPIPAGGSIQIQGSGLPCVTGSVTDPVHVPVSTSVLPPISAPQSSNNVEANDNSSVFAPLEISNSFLTTIFPSASLSSPLGTASQLTPLLSPTHLYGATVGCSLSSNNCVGQTIIPKDQVASPLEPWAPKSPLLEDLNDSSREGKWEMWDAPQLNQIQLSNLAEPLQWALPSNNEALEPKITASLPRTPLDSENELSSCLFSPQQNDCSMDNNTGYVFGSLPLSTSTNNSLWSDQSAFQSALRIWEDSDSHRQVPPEFVDCITREIMLDPVITADGHSYERSAIEFWLKTHDTSPITGEVLPPPPGGDGTGVDKTLRPNHILRGQIIEYKERVARGLSTKRMGLETGWSMFTGQGSPAWSTTTSSVQIPHLGDYYSTPGSQSLWAYDMSKV